AVKSIFGIILAVSALYLLKSGFPALSHLARPDRSFALVAFALFVAGIAIGAVHLTFDGSPLTKIRKAMGIVASVAGAFLILAWIEAPRATLTWEASESAARTRAETEHRPMLVDFTAEWCGACKELARITFADPKVMVEANRFVAVRVDATNDEDASVDAIKDHYGVVGLPTVIVLGSDGRERTRLTEFMPPERFLDLIRNID
ncbi:MAG TPA: thioredoxin family protein, partial [Polyangiaceae bacterium]